MSQRDGPADPDLRSSLVNRRDFIKATSLAGASAVVAPTLVASVATADTEAAEPKSAAPPPASLPADEDLEAFIKLSEALTGVQPLDRDRTLAIEYFQRCTEYPDVGAVLPQLLQVYKGIDSGNAETEIKTRIMADPKLRAAAEQMIFLWYISAFFVPDASDPQKIKGAWRFGSLQQYDKALVWPVIKAHAPMTQGGPYGYWSDPPTD